MFSAFAIVLCIPIIIYTAAKHNYIISLRFVSDIILYEPYVAAGKVNVLKPIVSYHPRKNKHQ